MINITEEPRGEVYKQLIEYAVNKCDTFTFWMDEEKDYSKKTKDIVEKLQPYRCYGRGNDDKINKKENPRKIYRYKCCKDVIEILQNAAEGSKSWKYPNLPEYLSFNLNDRKEWLSMGSFSDTVYIEDDENEARKLYDTIKGLAVRGDFNCTLDMILKDAKERNYRELHLSEMEIKEFPYEIDEMENLKVLNIRYCDISKLPGSIKNLINLEEVILHNLSLKELPIELFKLKNLKHLGIINTEVKSIPIEIGDLVNLESLNICNNGLSSIPKEVGNLKKLESILIIEKKVKREPLEVSMLNCSKIILVGNEDVQTFID